MGATPTPPRRLPRRLTQLLGGLLVMGFGYGLLLLAGLGVDPWNVLHQGLARHTGLAVGTATILVGVVVLLAWVPLRQRPGIGTIGNALLVGLVVNATLSAVPAPTGIPWRVAYMVLGVALTGLSTGCYIGAGLGPGPRDGVMTAFAARGHSIRRVRTVLEVGALLGGWALGGNVGVGTLLFAASIGPLAHVFIPLFTVRAAAIAATAVGASADAG